MAGFSPRTTKVPMLNRAPNPILCLSGSESEATIGIGRAMIKTSLLRLNVACTIAKCWSVVHCGLGGGIPQYPLNGRHAVKKAI